MIYRITVYPDILNDPICQQSYADENEMNVDEVLRVMSCFVVKTRLAYKHKDKMIRALEKQDHIKFYKLIASTANRLIKELE